jgi:hypothetical protein
LLGKPQNNVTDPHRSRRKQKQAISQNASERPDRNHQALVGQQLAESQTEPQMSQEVDTSPIDDFSDDVVQKKYALFRRMIDQIAKRVAADAQLDRTNLMSHMYIAATRHHYYLSLLSTAKIKLAAAKKDQKNARTRAELSYRANQKTIKTQSSITEAKLIIETEVDVQLADATAEGCQLVVDYLAEVVQIFISQKYIYKSITDMIKADAQ